MAEKNVDRRVRRTRSLLMKAALDLIVEKGFDAVTVQDILDRADVGRSTFYAHFRDKDDLLMSGFEIFHAELAEAVSATDRIGGPTLSDIALVLFRHAGAHRREFRAMMSGTSGEMLTRAARQNSEKHLREEMRASGSHALNAEVVAAVIEFQANTLLSLLSWWLNTESKLSPEEMHKLFITLTTPGVDAVLRSADASPA